MYPKTKEYQKECYIFLGTLSLKDNTKLDPRARNKEIHSGKSILDAYATTCEPQAQFQDQKYLLTLVASN